MEKDPIEAEIVRQAGHSRYGLNSEIRVDAAAWATLALRLGYGVEWAMDWINHGYPSPPPWMYSGRGAPPPRGEAVTDEELAKIEKRAHGWTLIDRSADEGGPVSNPAADDALVLVRELRAAREVVGRDAVQWGATLGQGDRDGILFAPACPVCRRFKTQGHAPDCALAAALGRP